MDDLQRITENGVCNFCLSTETLFDWEDLALCEKCIEEKEKENV